ncbi:uncharacterized protein RCH25_004665 [Pelodytes ibericus]
MLVSTSMASKDGGLNAHSPIQFNDSTSPEHFSAAEIPAPPPPPPPNLNFSGSSGCQLQKLDTKRRSRLRNFNWEAIPLEKVKGRPSLWSSETFQGDLQIDTGRMEELFGKQEEENQLRSPRPRRSLSLGDTQMSKVFLLDSRKSMNIGIFLKQFKRSAAEIVEDIKIGNGDAYSSEKLNELLKHLPEREEVKCLRSFEGDRERLSEADLFMLLLLELPSYALRVEALIFKKDFHTVVLSLLSTARDLKGAAEELLQCTELHYILKLVLKAGNFMNAGGYAGNAAGFRVSSLLKLADTKANKPGMNLLHFVVMEVQKKDARLLSFADRLKHVSISSRLSEDGLLDDFCKLQSRLTSMRQALKDPEEKELREQMEEFLEYAEEQLLQVQKEIEALQSSRHLLVEFLCEDEESFHLEECCKIFSCFCQKFQLAIKENKIRELEEQRQQLWEKKHLQKRHSMATCSSLEGWQVQDDLELTLEKSLRNAHKPTGLRLCRMRSFRSSCSTSPMPQKTYREKTQDYCDQQNANQMRQVSERVLTRQMGYTVCKDARKADAGGLCSLQSIDAMDSGTIRDQTEPQNPSQSPDQIESEISKQSPLFQSERSSKIIKNHQDQDEPQLFTNSSTHSGARFLRKSITLSEPKSFRYLLAATEETAPGVVQKEARPPIFIQALEHPELEEPGQLPAQAEVATNQQLLDQSGKDISQQSLTQTEVVIPQQLQEHSRTDISKQLPPQSVDVGSRQLVTKLESDALHSSPAEQEHKCYFNSLVSSIHENPDQLISPTKRATYKHSLIQYVEGSIRHKPTEPRTIKPNQLLSQSGCGTSKKSQTPSGHGTPSLLLYPSRIKVPKHSPVQDSICKSLDHSGDEDSRTSLAKPGPETTSQQEDTSGSEPSSPLLSHSQSKIPRHSEAHRASVLEPTHKTTTQGCPYSEPESSRQSSAQPELDTTTQTVAQTKQVYPKESPVQPEPKATTQSSARYNVTSMQSAVHSGNDTALQFSIQDKPEIPKKSGEQSELDTSRKSIAQSNQKSSKQSPCQTMQRIPRQSIPKPAIKTPRQSLDQSVSETSNLSKPETAKYSLAQPGGFISKIQLSEPVSVKHLIKAKEINVQIPASQEKPGPSQTMTARASRVRDVVECKSITKGHTVVIKDTANHCSKWKKELQNTSDREDGGKKELKPESNSLEVNWNNSGHSCEDNHKNLSTVRNPNSTAKKSKNGDYGFGVRRVHLNKEASSVGVPSTSGVKQRMPTPKETRDSKLPHKMPLYCTGTLKPSLGKIVGTNKEKKESPRPNTVEQSKVSERKWNPQITSKCSITSTQKPGESSWHNVESTRESSWTSHVAPKKTNSVARVAIHVIRNSEFNSSIPRGSKSLHLDPQPIWR